jgi:hypothetical protein
MSSSNAFLASGESESVDLPFFSNTDQHRIFRHGVPADGSCMLHALFYLTSSAYRETNDKVQFMNAVRGKLVDACSPAVWMDMEVSKLAFQMRIAQNGAVAAVLGENEQYVTQLFPPTELEKALHAADTALTHGNTKEYVQVFLGVLMAHYDKKVYTLVQPGSSDETRALNLRAHIDQQLTNLCKTTLRQSYDTYIEELRNANMFNLAHVDFLSRVLELNIHFVSASTLRPYQTCTAYDPARKHVVLYYIDDTHFESLEIHNTETGIGTRRFDTHHPFIQAILA